MPHLTCTPSQAFVDVHVSLESSVGPQGLTAHHTDEGQIAVTLLNMVIHLLFRIHCLGWIIEIHNYKYYISKCINLRNYVLGPGEARNSIKLPNKLDLEDLIY